ncbi:MAG: META domain-containing protein [Alteromonadaceae bacterium]|nr:META domain-containing protein [Alteromonadaceae bacterium]
MNKIITMNERKIGQNFRHQIMVAFIAIMTIVITGCGSSSDEEVTFEDARQKWNELQNASATWNNQLGRYYKIQSQRICECLPEMSSQMMLSVLDNSILAARDINTDETISSETKINIKTVDDIFDLIQEAIDDSVTIDVTYNQEYGYPETTRLNIEQLAVDGGLHIELSNLTVEDPISALDDVTWQLTAYDSIVGPQEIIEGSNVSMTFDLDNNQLSGSGGCNSFNADFVMVDTDTNNNITIFNILNTEMSCESPEKIMEQEQIFFATLTQTSYFTFDKATLSLSVGADAGLHFKVSD